MPKCQNCGSHVTDDYARVFTPTGVEQPRVCVHCDDQIRDGAGVRSARAPRAGNDEDPSGYDETYAEGDD